MADKRDTLRVFISYARRDGAVFAEELLHGLEVAGFDAFLDRHDIAAAEDWETRLGALIQSADTVVFVLTPAAAASERCAWEVDRAEQLAKRIVPIISIPVEEAATPERLKRLNYIYFTEGNSYSVSLGKLAAALRVDLAWIREHTRLGELAQRWRQRGQSDALLLRGGELDAVRQWLANRSEDSPPITDAHREFIAASEAAEGELVKRERARRRALILSLSAATFVFAALGAAAAIFGVIADNNARLARQALGHSLIERAWVVSENQRELAIKYVLAGVAVEGEGSDLARSALAFAVERGEGAAAIGSGLSAPVQVSAISPNGLFVALVGQDGQLVFVDITRREVSAPVQLGAARHAGFSADGRRLFVILEDNSAVLIDRTSGASAAIGGVGSAVNATFSPDGERIVLSGFEPQARLWDLASGRELNALSHQSYVTATQFSADGSRILTASGDNSARVWDAATGAAISAFQTDSYVIDAVFSADGVLIATSEGRQLSATAGTHEEVEATNGAIKIWDAHSGGQSRTIAHTEDVTSLAFSPDSTRLFGLDDLGRFIQWDVETGRVVTMFDGRRFGVTDGVFAPDGATFVGRSPRFAAVLWEAATNRVIGLLPIQGSASSRVLGGAGSVSVLLLDDGRIVVWDFSRALQPAGRLAEEACSVLRARSELTFSDLEMASDPLIAEAWRRPNSRPLC